MIQNSHIRLKLYLRSQYLGFTLTELLIAALMAVVVSGALIGGMVALQQDSQNFEELAKLQSELRRASQYIAADARGGLKVESGAPTLSSPNYQPIFQINFCSSSSPANANDCFPDSPPATRCPPSSPSPYNCLPHLIGYYSLNDRIARRDWRGPEILYRQEFRFDFTVSPARVITLGNAEALVDRIDLDRRIIAEKVDQSDIERSIDINRSIGTPIPIRCPISPLPATINGVHVLFPNSSRTQMIVCLRGVTPDPNKPNSNFSKLKFIEEVIQVSTRAKTLLP